MVRETATEEMRQNLGFTSDSERGIGSIIGALDLPQMDLSSLEVPFAEAEICMGGDQVCLQKRHPGRTGSRLDSTNQFGPR